MRLQNEHRCWAAAIGALLASVPLARSQLLFVLNASFESPSTAFVDNRLERWQTTPKPFWYDESGGFTWDQLFGVFRNTDPGKPDHIFNFPELASWRIMT